MSMRLYMLFTWMDGVHLPCYMVCYEYCECLSYSKESYLIDSGYWNKCILGHLARMVYFDIRNQYKKGFFISGCFKISGKMDILSKSEEKGYFITLLIITAGSGGRWYFGNTPLARKSGHLSMMSS